MSRHAFIRGIVETLRARFGRFEDGATIKRVSRDEYIYHHPDGRVVMVYVFLLLRESNAPTRSLDMDSLARWKGEGGGAPIAPGDQEVIVEKFRKYFAAYGEKMEAG